VNNRHPGLLKKDKRIPQAMNRSIAIFNKWWSYLSLLAFKFFTPSFDLDKLIIATRRFKSTRTFKEPDLCDVSR
ncbi:hypothetical protein, partial [Salmonella enterica]|uniref:hypothetical protein n=1 Tax=Salmonella enterica TaxID=28901 RepID=UPI00064638E9